MKNLHETATIHELINRLDKLTPDTQRLWGKMDVAQMLAHCSNALEVTLGDKVYKQAFLGKIFGKFAKNSLVSEKPIKQGIPTDPNFVVNKPVDFNKEKQRLISLLTRFSASDPEKIAENKHPFFGEVTADEWNTLTYKHMDHHLRQFGA